MTDLTERERQIVAWLRSEADALDEGAFYVVGNHRAALRTAASTYRRIATAIERGAHRGEQA